MIAVLMITCCFVFTAKGNVSVKAAKKHKKNNNKKGLVSGGYRNEEKIVYRDCGSCK